MKYKYQAKTKNGEMQVGVVEAGSREVAGSILTGHDLFILSIEEAESVHWYDNIVGLFNRVKQKDLVICTRQLATLLEVQIPLNQALKILVEQTANPVLKEAVFEIAEDVDSGLSLSQAMDKQKRVFPEFYVEMVRAAEVTGNLNQVATFLADY